MLGVVRVDRVYVSDGDCPARWSRGCVEMPRSLSECMPTPSPNASQTAIIPLVGAETAPVVRVGQHDVDSDRPARQGPGARRRRRTCSSRARTKIGVRTSAIASSPSVGVLEVLEGDAIGLAGSSTAPQRIAEPFQAASGASRRGALRESARGAATWCARPLRANGMPPLTFNTRKPCRATSFLGPRHKAAPASYFRLAKIRRSAAVEEVRGALDSFAPHRPRRGASTRARRARWPSGVEGCDLERPRTRPPARSSRTDPPSASMRRLPEARRGEHVEPRPPPRRRPPARSLAPRARSSFSPKPVYSFVRLELLLVAATRRTRSWRPSAERSGSSVGTETTRAVIRAMRNPQTLDVRDSGISPLTAPDLGQGEEDVRRGPPPRASRTGGRAG